MWRYLLVGLGGAVVGVAIFIGAVVLLLPEGESSSRVLCADALARRRQVEVMMANPPQVQLSSGRTITDQAAQQQARDQLNQAAADINRYCT